MAGTVVQTLLVLLCLLNTNLFCVQAASFQRSFQHIMKAEADYTIEIRDAKIVSFLPEYFSNKTVVYATMYNDSYTVVDGIIELLKIPPPDAVFTIDLSKFDSSTNKWGKTTSVVKSNLCGHIKNNLSFMNVTYQCSNFTAKECPVYPGVYAVQHYHLDTEMFPNHVPESTYRAFFEMHVKGSNEPAISGRLVADVVPKIDNDD